MAEITTPIDFMHQLMYKLQYTYDNDENKLNLSLADLTNISGKTQITDWTQLRDMIKADITTNLNNGGTAKDFLKNYCNIDLDNDDCGALIGYDCSGGEILDNDNIIDETGELQSHPASAVIGGCTITFPTFSDSTYNYVMDGLYTWWIGLPFDLVKTSYGLEFNNDSYVHSMPVNLYDEPPSGGLVTGAYVETYFNLDTYKAVGLELCINMNNAAYGTIIIGDKSGNTTVGNFGALDRTLAHELTHALMNANIRGPVWFPDWFKEGGTAVLVEGCDDTRKSSLLAAAVSTSIIDDGFSSSPTNAREYSVGFIAMRYLLKKYTDKQQQIIFPVKPKEPFEIVWEKMAHGIRSEHCISRDGDLNKIMNEFVDFCQRDDYNLVQPWALCSNAGSKTLRIPLEGHEYKVEDEICVFGNSDKDTLYSVLYNDASVILSNTLFFGNFSSTIPSPITGGSLTFRLGFSTLASSLWKTDKNIDKRDVFYDINDSYSSIKSSFYYEAINVPDNISVTPVIDEYWYSRVTNTEDAITDIISSFVSNNAKNIVVSISENETFDMYSKEQYDELINIIIQHNNESNVDGYLYLVPLHKCNNVYNMPMYTVSSTLHYEDMILPNLSINISDYISNELRNYLLSTGRCKILLQIPKLLLNNPTWDDDNYMSWSNNTSVGWPMEDEVLHRCLWRSNSCYIQSIGLMDDLVVNNINEDIFKIEQKKDIDFPCFYLSTGVFKPSTWNGQGLTYPSSAVSNVNDEYIPFNIHVLNDYRMRFDLQGVGTCKRVTGKEGDADILNGIRQTGQYSYAADVISDLIPGIGCPLIVRSVENKAIYNTILCYFTKTDYSGTFTLIFYDEYDDEKPPVFQSVAFGLGITEEESYKYPLYTAGGTSGLYPAYYSFSYMPGPTAREPVTLHIYGNEFNFDMEKGDTLDSLLYPVATTRCGISNFRVLQPDGRWKSVINWRQVFYKGGANTCGAYITKNNGNNVKDYLVYPTISDTTNVDRYVLVQPITVIKKHIDGEDESGFLMSINGVKCKPDRLRSMFSELDGHEYLVVPNGWYDRTLGLPLINSVSITEIMDLLQKMPKQTYVLCVDLG